VLAAASAVHVMICRSENLFTKAYVVCVFLFFATALERRMDELI
jgi:hypothetical protein